MMFKLSFLITNTTTSKYIQDRTVCGAQQECNFLLFFPVTLRSQGGKGRRNILFDVYKKRSENDEG